MQTRLPAASDEAIAAKAEGSPGRASPDETRCSGSWFPARNRAVGTRASCATCGREVTITPPPPDPTHDPWWGARVNRYAPHIPRSEGKPEG
jgi:hypothetical protein